MGWGVEFLNIGFWVENF